MSRDELRERNIFGVSNPALEVRFVRHFIDKQIERERGRGGGKMDGGTKGFRLRPVRMIKVKVTSFNEQHARDKDAADRPRQPYT